jgi:hypothetical protein
MKIPIFRYEITDKPNTEMLRPYEPPLGPFIEYMAHKSGVLSPEIIYFVAELDKEMIESGTRTRTKTMDPEAAYDKVIGSCPAAKPNKATKKPGAATKKGATKKSPPKKSTTKKPATKKSAAKSSTPKKGVANKPTAKKSATAKIRNANKPAPKKNLVAKIVVEV